MSDLTESIRALEAESISVRQSAVTRLGESGDARAVEPLLSALRDPEWSVRASAATSIGKLYYQASPVRAGGSDRLVDALLPLLDSIQPGLKINTMRSLGWIGNKRATNAVRKFINDPEDHVREEAITTLGALGDSESASLIAPLLHHSDKWTRSKAAAALGKIGGDRALELLVAALRDKESVVRNSAVNALQSLGNPRCIGPLRKLLRDENADVRFWTIQAVVGFKDKASLPVLADMAKNDTDFGNGSLLSVVAAKAYRLIKWGAVGKLPLWGLVDGARNIAGLAAMLRRKA